MNVEGIVNNYNEYLSWLKRLVEENKTSGNNQSPALIGFTALNLKRMMRLSKTIEIDNRIIKLVESFVESQIWYVIAETWCGDCAQNIPAIGEIAELSNGVIDLRIIQRDENPAWMEKYHTEGSKSIPKLISFDRRGNELFTWGPRPIPAQMILKSWKQNPDGRSWDDFERELHTWYSKDKTITIQNELFQLLSHNERV
jgi:hypothetical protein